jgi:tripartite-type tricarboxylate transporter receptor subunit TctC
MRTPNVMLVNPSVPAKSVPEFIAYAEANPGKISFASAGNGSGSHMSGELFKMMTGVDMVHVPYRGGGPALTDLLSGQVQLMFPGTAASISYIRAGTLRPLAVTTATRSEVLPDIPTVGDSVPGYESSLVDGLGAPKNAPPEVIDRLNKEINAGLADPKLKARLADLGGTVLPGSPADFGKLIADETEKWAKVVKFSGAKPD